MIDIFYEVDNVEYNLPFKMNIFLDCAQTLETAFYVDLTESSVEIVWKYEGMKRF